MKKVYFFIIIYAIFIFILSIAIYKTFNPKKMGEIYSSLYEALDYQISKIETNMNEITISNDEWKWAEIKETNTNDEKLKNTYNSLISDIRTYYLTYYDLENKTYNNLKILSFEDKTSIADDELSELNNRDNYLKVFDKYNSMVLSDNQQLSDKIKKQINIIIDYSDKSSSNKTFDELLYDELVTTSKIASLASWLKTEYYSNID